MCLGERVTGKRIEKVSTDREKGVKGYGVNYFPSFIYISTGIGSEVDISYFVYMPGKRAFKRGIK